MGTVLKESPNYKELRFRIELQFHLVCEEDRNCLTSESMRLHPILTQLWEHLRNTMRDTIAVEQATTSKNPFISQWQIRLGPHNFLDMIVPRGYQSLPIALMSPIYRFSSAIWENNIKRLLGQIRRFSEDHGARAFCNPSTSLHVQVGTLGLEPILPPAPLQVAKNLLRLVTGFEQYFDALHPISHFEGIAGKRPRSLPPSQLLQRIPELSRKEPRDWLRKIDSFESNEELHAIFTVLQQEEHGISRSCCAYNLSNFTAGPDDRVPNGWIEYRQHIGTLEEKEITNWITFCCFLTLRAESNHENLERDFINEQIMISLADDDIHFSFLEYLKMPQSVIDFYEKKIHLASGNFVDESQRYAKERFEETIKKEPESTNFYKLHVEIAGRRFYDEHPGDVSKILRQRRNRGAYGMLHPNE